jgi:hypothetical protein
MEPGHCFPFVAMFMFGSQKIFHNTFCFIFFENFGPSSLSQRDQIRNASAETLSLSAAHPLPILSAPLPVTSRSGHGCQRIYSCKNSCNCHHCKQILHFWFSFLVLDLTVSHAWHRAHNHTMASGRE